MAKLLLDIMCTPQAFLFNPVTGQKKPAEVDISSATQLSCYAKLEKDYTKAPVTTQDAIKSAFLAECLKLKALGKFQYATKEPYISPKGVNVAFASTERKVEASVSIDIPD